MMVLAGESASVARMVFDSGLLLAIAEHNDCESVAITTVSVAEQVFAIIMEANSIALPSSSNDVVNFEPFLISDSVTLRSAGSPMVQTRPAPPSLVPALAEPSVYRIRVGLKDLNWDMAASIISSSRSFLLDTLGRCL